MINLYIENTERIIRNTKLIKSDILDLEKNPNKEIYLNFFKFCFENLELQSSKFGIEPSYFFYMVKENYINAGATCHEGDYIIHISEEFISKLFEKLNSNKLLFENDRLIKYKILSKSINTDLIDIIFQSSTIFTYYHEFAHLVQKKGRNFDLNETIGNFDLFIPENHILEYDADLNGSQFVFGHISDFYENLEIENRNTENLKTLLPIALSGILITFLLLYNREFDKVKIIDEFYLDKKTHPHTIIRISYIIQHYQGIAKENGVEIELVELLKETFLICEIFFNSNSFVKDCFNILENNLNEINNYNNLLFDEANKNNNLIMHKINKNK